MFSPLKIKENKSFYDPNEDIHEIINFAEKKDFESLKKIPG